MFLKFDPSPSRLHSFFQAWREVICSSGERLAFLVRPTVIALVHRTDQNASSYVLNVQTRRGSTQFSNGTPGFRFDHCMAAVTTNDVLKLSNRPNHLEDDQLMHDNLMIIHES